MSEIRYIPSSESTMRTPEHSFHIIVEKEDRGSLHVKYMNKPFPYYYASYLEVNPKEQGKGYGKQLLLKFNKFLDEKGKMGILCDTIDPSDNPDAVGMYERNGWTRISDGDEWLYYNKPNSISQELLEKAVREVKSRRWGYESLMD